jgi:iron complex outermembrane receptor protein
MPPLAARQPAGQALQQLPASSPACPGGNFAPAGSKREESEFSGTAVISFKPIDQLLTYASYSRGYKAGGFNLDRSGFNRTLRNNNRARRRSPPPTLDLLEFAPEINDAFELGAKYNGRGIDVNVAPSTRGSRLPAQHLQRLNFFVENINSCKNRPERRRPRQHPGNGACTGDDQARRRSRGVESSCSPARCTDVAVNFGATFVNTRYANNLVGPTARRSPALFQLPGRRLSNSSAFAAPARSASTRGSRTAASAPSSTSMPATSRSSTPVRTSTSRRCSLLPVVNGRIGLQGPDRRWGGRAVGAEPLQRGLSAGRVRRDAAGQRHAARRSAGLLSPPSNQLFGAFLAEPRTYGLTLRTRL